MDYVSRYEKLLQAQNIKYLRFGSLLLREYNGIIIPLGPIKCNKPEQAIESKQVFKFLRGKLLWWSYFDGNTNDNWYGVVKYNHIEVADYPSTNTRNQIRKGLNNCEVRKIDLTDLLSDGYVVYRSAVKPFIKQVIPLETYNQQLGITDAFDDIIHYWGIYFEKKLIGYAVIYTYDNLEANISEVRIMSNFNAYYPSYALFHELSSYYLHQNHFEYLSDGYRNLMHKTDIQLLLMQKFGFVKMGLNLQLYIRSPYGLIMRLVYGFKAWIKTPSLLAVLKLMTIYKKQKGQ